MTEYQTHSSKPVAYDREVPEIYAALIAAESAVRGQGVDHKLLDLVKLRVSQINRCAFCIGMHLREARKDGVPAEQIDGLIVWRHNRHFGAAERALLAWAEALTELGAQLDPAPLRAALREHFSDQDISTLTVAIAMINMWNRLQVSRH